MEPTKSATEERSCIPVLDNKARVSAPHIEAGGQPGAQLVLLELLQPPCDYQQKGANGSCQRAGSPRRRVCKYYAERNPSTPAVHDTSELAHLFSRVVEVGVRDVHHLADRAHVAGHDLRMLRVRIGVERCCCCCLLFLLFGAVAVVVLRRRCGYHPLTPEIYANIPRKPWGQSPVRSTEIIQDDRSLLGNPLPPCALHRRSP